MASSRVYDAVVVGSGASGGWAAKELCEAGLDVIVLEAGRSIDPSVDYPEPPPPRRRLASRVMAAPRGQAVQMRCPAFDARTRRFFVSDRAHPYTTPPASPFNWFRGRQVGGRLHVWARVSLRLTSRDLADWPMSCEELEPHYDAVEHFLDVRAADLNATEQRFRSDVRDLAPVLAPPLAALETARTPRTLRAAAATGRLTLRADAVVRTVTVDGSGMATGVSLVDRQRRVPEHVRGRTVVLAASTIETLRILLASSSARHPGGLGNSSGMLGRYFADHVLTGIGGPLDQSAADEPEPADPYDVGSATGFLIPPESRGDGAHPPAPYGIQGGLGRGQGSWYMLAHGEMTVRPENRVTLDDRRTDASGARVARVACVHSAPESAMAATQLDLMHRLAARSGLRVRTPPSGRVVDRAAYRLAKARVQSANGAFLPGSAAHELGGARMGADPATSVLDPWGRVWDAENVLVTDAASFPTGCWQNTTLTIMALTRRACRRLAEERRAGRG